MPACAACCHIFLAPDCVAGGPKCMSASKRQIMHSRTRTGRATPFGQRRTKPLVRQAACISSLVVLALLVCCSLRTLPPDFVEVTFELQRIAYVSYDVSLSANVQLSSDLNPCNMIRQVPIEDSSTLCTRDWQLLAQSLHPCNDVKSLLAQVTNCSTNNL